ncbi:MAG: hypothetical protein WBB07_01395 [Mycobacterium sp.]
MTLYRDADVKFGGQDVGGIRVSHISGIEKRLKIALTTSRGQRKPFFIEPLPDQPAPARGRQPTATSIIGAFDGLGMTIEQLETRTGSAHDKWEPDDINGLAAVGKAIKAGATTTAAEFPTLQPSRS